VKFGDNQTEVVIYNIYSEALDIYLYIEHLLVKSDYLVYIK